MTRRRREPDRGGGPAPAPRRRGGRDRRPRACARPPPSESARQRGLDGGLEPLPRGERGVDGGGLVAAVDHAVLALLVAAPVAVAFPARRLHQLLEGGGVAFLEQIARALPAEHVVGGIAPRRALEVPLAHEEL